MKTWNDLNFPLHLYQYVPAEIMRVCAALNTHTLIFVLVNYLQSSFIKSLKNRIELLSIDLTWKIKTEMLIFSGLLFTTLSSRLVWTGACSARIGRCVGPELKAPRNTWMWSSLWRNCWMTYPSWLRKRFFRKMQSSSTSCKMWWILEIRHELYQRNDLLINLNKKNHIMIWYKCKVNQKRHANGTTLNQSQSVPVTWFLPCETDRQIFC